MNSLIAYLERHLRRSGMKEIRDRAETGRRIVEHNHGSAAVLKACDSGQYGEKREMLLSVAVHLNKARLLAMAKAHPEYSLERIIEEVTNGR